MKNIVLLFLLFCLILIPLDSSAQYDEGEMSVVRLNVRDSLMMKRVMDANLDLMEERDGDDLFAWVNQQQLVELKKNGFDVRVDEIRTNELRNLLQTDTFNGGYRTVEETQQFLVQMSAQFPNLAQVVTYGQSWQKTQNAATGYNLTAIKLTNRNITGDKPTFFLEAGIHARELVPPEIATRFIEYLLKNYGKNADATWLLDEHTIIVVPLVNPDGRKVAETNPSKRKNTNITYGNCTISTLGVDLNRNFSYLWGTVNMPTTPVCDQTFPALSAASEPETQGIQNYLNSIYPDQRGPLRTDPAPLDATGIFLDMHSTGNLVLYPWGQDNTPPPNLQLRTIARKAASYNGYNPIQSIELYPTSGTAREYGYGELGIAGLAMEIGLGSGTCGGFAPAYSCIDGGGTSGDFWNKNRPVLLYLSKLARTPYMTGEGANAETLTVNRTGTNTFALRSQISDVSNGNQNVTAAEVYVDTPPWRGGIPVAMTAEDGSFNSPNEFAVINLTLSPGRHILYVRGRDSDGNWGAIKAEFTPRTNVTADFDGDGRTDVSVYRPNSAGAWYVLQSSNAAFSSALFGASEDIPAPGDFDGDGKTDYAVFRPSNGTFYILQSTNGFAAYQFGQNGDVPVVRDYDGDGKVDVAVYRGGFWYILNSSNNSPVSVHFGAPNDKPVQGDYDGDGKFDVAVFRPSDGVWYLLKSTEGFTAFPFGISTDKPIQADYDADGKTDIAVFRDGFWYIQQSRDGFTGLAFGFASDKPVPGDYDGDGRADVSVYRPSNGAWYLNQSADGFTARIFGASTDKPIPAAYISE